MKMRYVTASLTAALVLPMTAPTEARVFGPQIPFSVADLPPGQFRQALENLPPVAQQRAMTWLNGFSFPAQDTQHLRVDQQGGIFYADLPLTEANAAGVTAPEAITLPAADPNVLFTLHSKPGASRIVFLDFDGHTISGTAWNSTYSQLQAKAFDLDGNPDSFNATEAASIAEIWHRIAEDYAPYDIDVTTQDPATQGIAFGPQVGRVLITKDSDQQGQPMPSMGAGGVAYVNVWGRSDYASLYSPALVYYNNLANGTTYIAEAASHELGHNLGLGHDGSATASYYSGLGSDSSLVSWAPIMGVGYYKNVTQWSRGEYSGASNSQDDLAIIANKLTYRPDDHGDDTANASLLQADGNGMVSATNPENDAYNGQPQNKGIIGRNQNGALIDRDLFYFDADSGPLTLSVTPAWDAFTRTLRRGANLDIKATLLDQNGTTVASSDPNDDTLASLTINLQQGRYYLAIEGVGNSQTPYSNYASLGQYFISGQFPPSGTQVNLPPSAAFSVSCDGFNCNFSDNSYDSDGTIVAWQWDFADDTRSTLTNPSHTYTAPGNYTVVLWVTDDQGLQSSAQQQVSISDPNAVPPSMPTALLTTDNANGSASISWNGDATATSYEIQRETRHPKNGRWTSTTLLSSVTAPLTTLTDSSGTGTFRYSVRALNSYGVSGWSSWSQITVSDSTGGGSGGGGGGGGKCSPRKNSC